MAKVSPRTAPKITREVTPNAALNRMAWRSMSLLERECGITPDEFERSQAEQRARVRARWLTPAEATR